MLDQSAGSTAIAVVGDVYLSRSYPQTAFDRVREAFDAADCVLGNLESTLTTHERDKFIYPWASLDSSPAMAPGLEFFDVLSLANNHGMDCGRGGLLETIDVVSEHGVEVIGAGADEAAAARPAVFSDRGSTIGVLAYEATHWSWGKMQAGPDKAGMNVVPVSPFYADPKVSEFGMERYRDTIERVADDVDVLLVMLHSGIAADRTIAVHQRALAEGAVDAGADAVLGSHPHILQPVDVYRGAPIVYSFSNFVFDSPTLDFPRETVLAHLEVTDGALDGMDLYPVYINDSGQPEFPSPGSDAYERTADDLVSLSEREGTTLEREESHLRVPI